jgi:hypothetical protein
MRCLGAMLLLLLRSSVACMLPEGLMLHMLPLRLLRLVRPQLLLLHIMLGSRKH